MKAMNKAMKAMHKLKISYGCSLCFFLGKVTLAMKALDKATKAIRILFLCESFICQEGNEGFHEGIRFC